MTLEIEFKSGAIYQYFDVSESEYKNLISAESIGTYLNQKIKNSYRYARI